MSRSVFPAGEGRPFKPLGSEPKRQAKPSLGRLLLGVVVLQMFVFAILVLMLALIVAFERLVVLL